MLYLANTIIAASDGYTPESRDNAAERAQRLLITLIGPQPETKKRPPRAKDFVR